MGAIKHPLRIARRVLKTVPRNKKPIVIGLLLLGFALRLRLSTHTVSLWDEAYDWIPIAYSISLAPDQFYLPIHDGPHPSLPAYFIRAGSELIGPSLLGLRFFSVAAGMATLALVFRLAAKLAPRSAAAPIALLLLSANEYHVAMSVFAIQKSYQFLAVVTAVLLFALFLERQKPRYLYSAAVAAGLGVLCHEITLLIGLAFLLALVLSRNRRWFARKEPYIALLLFLATIAPEEAYQLGNTAHGVPFAEHLSRFGQIGINRQPLLFYFRNVARSIFALLGKDFPDFAAEYPSMNSIFGGILLGGVGIVTLRWFLERSTFIKRRLVEKVLDTRLGRFLPSIQSVPSAQRRLLLLLFVIVFGFFTLQEPQRVYVDGLDPYVWFWADLSLFPAIMLTALLISAWPRNGRKVAYTFISAATVGAVYSVFVTSLGIPAFQMATRPKAIWPADGMLMPVTSRFQFCAACNPQPRIELFGVRVSEGTGALVPASAADLSDVEFLTDDRTIQLRALIAPGKAQRYYELVYRSIDMSGRVEYVRDYVGVQSPVKFLFPYWWDDDG